MIHKYFNTWIDLIAEKIHNKQTNKKKEKKKRKKTQRTFYLNIKKKETQKEGNK
jgi:hypothetical protein